MIDQFEAAQLEIGLNVEEEDLQLGWRRVHVLHCPHPDAVYCRSGSSSSRSRTRIRLRPHAIACRPLLTRCCFNRTAVSRMPRLRVPRASKRVILPPLLAMMPGLGRPIFGVSGGYLFVGKRTGGGKRQLWARPPVRDRAFAQSELYKEKALAIEANSTSFSFSDLNKWGEEMGQAMSAVTAMVQMLQTAVGGRSYGTHAARHAR